MDLRIRTGEYGLTAEGRHDHEDDLSTAFMSLLAVANFFKLDDDAVGLFSRLYPQMKDIATSIQTQIDPRFVEYLKERRDNDESNQ